MKTEAQLEIYRSVKSEFVDHTHFEDKAPQRLIERDAFINNLKYTPEYKYPRLDSLTSAKIIKKKRALYEAVLELDASQKNPDSDKAGNELFARSLEVRLKRIMLVEAARNLTNNNFVLSGMDVNRESFTKLNESLYGEFNADHYLGMVATEKSRVDTFVPKTIVAARIKSKLESLLGNVDVDGKREEALLGDVEIKSFHNFIINRYADVLGVVPDTADDVYYDVKQCAEIMNRALEVGGLAECGWKVVENAKKATPATRWDKSRIFLPSNTRRNASELRRLIIHEQEVHARRAQNGKDTGFKPLQMGVGDFADIEEGLGSMMECAVDGSFKNSSFDRARNRYITAGLALGADGKPRDAREVYEILWRITAVQDKADGNIDNEAVKKAKEKAYIHVENAYRGTQFWMKGVIYTKLKVYYEGLAKNADYFKRNIDNLDATFEDIFIGKYNHTDPVEKDLVKSIVSRKK